MLASFIIRYHTRRLDNLIQTLRFLNLWHKSVIEQSEVILLCQDRCGKIKTEFKETHNFNMNLPEMMMSHQLNFGINKSQSEKIVLLDSDRILPQNYFANALQQLQNKTMISCKRMIRITKMVSDEDIINNDFPYYEELRTDNISLTRNVFSGNVIFNKKDFLEFGGADENYIGYGWEDHDLTESMKSIGVHSIFRDEIEIHLHHELFSYGSYDQKKLFIKNGIRYCKKWKKHYPIELVKEMKNFI